MNADLLALALVNDPNFTLQEMTTEEPSEQPLDETRAAFEMLSNDGEVVGYVRTWNYDNSYAGFVHFDADGSVVDWKVFYKASIQ